MYPQNGDRSVTTDCVTSLHPIIIGMVSVLTPHWPGLQNMNIGGCCFTENDYKLSFAVASFGAFVNSTTKLSKN